MEIYITKHALSSFIEVAEATINPKSQIATLTATGKKYLRCDYELTEEAAIAQCRAARQKAVKAAEALVQFLRTDPLRVEWCEQGKRKLRLVTEE